MIEVFSRVVVDLAREQRVLEKKFDAFCWITVIEHEGVLGLVPGH
jgi:hypothetical protein